MIDSIVKNDIIVGVEKFLRVQKFDLLHIVAHNIIRALENLNAFVLRHDFWKLLAALL